MKINWDKFIRRDRGTLLFTSILFFASAVAMLFFYFDKEKIKSKNDITFIKGPFDEYGWIDLGGRGGSSLTFRLQNYSNRFKIKADFFPVLQKAGFTSIQSGDTLTVGIPNDFADYLNTSKSPFFVYSIVSDKFTYLDLQKVIPIHNSLLTLYAAGVFIILGCLFVYFGKRAKVKTKIW